jgi:two-component system response regulator HydG/two-component system response regulator AtoC
MERILIIDDDAGFRSLLETILAGENYEVAAGASVADARRLGGQRQFHLVLSDLQLPDGTGLEVLRWFAENAPEVPVIMITAFGTVPSAVEAMKLGAADYLGKPLSSPEELRLLVRKTLEQRQIACERDLLREQEQSRFQCGALIAGHPAMRQVLELARKVAPTNATVLLTGESGTGKEVLARCIHQNSQRAQRAFVAVNCAALSPTLIESELFGHEKGSFTGAVAQHVGRFERAHGGSLFLDEIGELDGNLQSKLLRVLQEKTFERVGGSRQIAVDVRIMAATNKDLKRQVADGRFRDDLFYRLSTFPLEVPALRDRSSDVPLLARTFLKKAAASLGRSEPALTRAAMDVLLSYGWPGNVRELENMMERTAILCEGEISPADLPIRAGDPTRPVRWKEIERQAILDALAMNHDNRTQAARQLGISLRTLQYRLKEYQLG